MLGRRNLQLFADVRVIKRGSGERLAVELAGCNYIRKARTSSGRLYVVRCFDWPSKSGAFIFFIDQIFDCSASGGKP